MARAISNVFAVLHALGVAPNRMVTLEVAGRRSGRPISLPLAMVVSDQSRYLVSMLGENASWVRNVRAAHGKARLRHGKTQYVDLVELPIDRRTPILQAYLKIAPGDPPHVPVGIDAPLEQLESIASQFPVFEVRALDSTKS